MNFMYAFTLPLLFWCEDDVRACSMFISLRNCLNDYDVKYMPASEVIYWGEPNSRHFVCFSTIELFLWHTKPIILIKGINV